MAKKPALLEFHVPFQFVGKIDDKNGIIYGVSLITGGIKAKGHDLEIDDLTIQQLDSCGTMMKKVPVKWNHKTGADAVNGYITNFWIDAAASALDGKAHWRGDWHLLKSHAQYKQALELAETMPECVALSVAFAPPLKQSRADQGKARCEELISCDLVANGAANPGGLFNDPRFQELSENDPDFAEFVTRFFEESRGQAGSLRDDQAGSLSYGLVDTGARTKFMKTKSNAAPNDTDQDKEPTLAEVIALMKTQGEQIKALTDQFGNFQAEVLANQPLSLEQLQEIAKLDDAKLAELDLTRAEVEAAVADAEAGIAEEGEDADADANKGPAYTGSERNKDSIVGADKAGAALAGPVAAEMAALRRQVTELSRKWTLQEQAANAEVAETLFSELEGKFVTLQARNEALETAIKAGGASVSASGEILFESGTVAEPNGAKREPLAFDRECTKKFAELMKDGKTTAVAARAQAVDFCVRRFPAAYTEFRASHAQTIEFEAK